MKQTQTHAWSLAGEEAVAYSLARGKAAAVTRESGEVAACSLARERRRQQSRSLALGPRRAAPGDRPKSLLSAFKQTPTRSGKPSLSKLLAKF